MDRLAEEMRKMIKSLREKGVPEKEIYELLENHLLRRKFSPYDIQLHKVRGIA